MLSLMKRAQALLIATVACLALGCALTVPALAAGPSGTLTGKEYALLSSAEAKVTGVSKQKKSVNWHELLTVCRSVGSSTMLLSTQSGGCVADVRLFQGLAKFPGQESKCGTAQPHKDLCLVPLYAGLARDANAVYTTAVDARRVSLQRGFTGSCLDALGGDAKQIGEQRKLATETQILANDVKLAARVVEGKLPSSDVNVSKINADAKAFERDANLVLGQNSPKLSVCSHR
jgi:hypothetical protein